MQIILLIVLPTSRQIDHQALFGFAGNNKLFGIFAPQMVLMHE
jgi:hypothetical protein